MSLHWSMSAPVIKMRNRRVRAHIKELGVLRKFRQEHSGVMSLLNLAIPVEDIRTLAQQQLPPSSTPSRIQSLTDGEVQEQAGQARDWLMDVLDCHDKIFDSQHDLRMFMSAVQKEITGRQDRWSEKESLYMALTNPAHPLPVDRLQFACILALHLNLALRLQDVSKVAAVRVQRIQDAKKLDDELQKTREAIVDKVNSIKVDHFACAVSLSSLQPSATASIVDGNAGSCPICQNSYTDLSTFTIQDLIADYPVRIKHCGHIVGKSCLEQWMATPKMDPAKYPHRTCPLCRVKIEGVPAPPVPTRLKEHLKSDGRAMETVRELVLGYDLGPEECHEAVVACISMSIACTELLAEIHRQKGNGDSVKPDGNERILNERLGEVKKEMRAWGFRGTAAWKDICNEWMTHGVLRNE